MDRDYVRACYAVPQGAKKVENAGTTAVNYRRGPIQDWNTLATVNVYITGGGPWSMRLGDGREPASDILLTDYLGAELGFKNSEWMRPGQLGVRFIANPTWHGFDMKFNVLTGDGHAGTIDFVDTYADTTKNLYTGNQYADTRTTDWDWRD